MTSIVAYKHRWRKALPLRYFPSVARQLLDLGIYQLALSSGAVKLAEQVEALLAEPFRRTIELRNDNRELCFSSRGWRNDITLCAEIDDNEVSQGRTLGEVNPDLNALGDGLLMEGALYGAMEIGDPELNMAESGLFNCVSIFPDFISSSISPLSNLEDMISLFDAFGDHGLPFVLLERIQSPQQRWSEAGELNVRSSEHLKRMPGMRGSSSSPSVYLEMTNLLMEAGVLEVNCTQDIRYRLAAEWRRRHWSHASPMENVDHWRMAALELICFCIPLPTGAEPRSVKRNSLKKDFQHCPEQTKSLDPSHLFSSMPCPSSTAAI